MALACDLDADDQRCLCKKLGFPGSEMKEQGLAWNPRGWHGDGKRAQPGRRASRAELSLCPRDTVGCSLEQVCTAMWVSFLAARPLRVILWPA